MSFEQIMRLQKAEKELDENEISSLKTFIVFNLIKMSLQNSTQCESLTTKMKDGILQCNIRWNRQQMWQSLARAQLYFSTFFKVKFCWCCDTASIAQPSLFEIIIAKRQSEARRNKNREYKTKTRSFCFRWIITYQKVRNAQTLHAIDVTSNRLIFSWVTGTESGIVEPGLGPHVIFTSFHIILKFFVYCASLWVLVQSIRASFFVISNICFVFFLFYFLMSFSQLVLGLVVIRSLSFCFSFIFSFHKSSSQWYTRSIFLSLPTLKRKQNRKKKQFRQRFFDFFLLWILLKLKLNQENWSVSLLKCQPKINLFMPEIFSHYFCFVCVIVVCNFAKFNSSWIFFFGLRFCIGVSVTFIAEAI